MVYCGCLENSWVNSPRGSNPFPSADKAMKPFSLVVSVLCCNADNTHHYGPRVNSNVDSVRQLREASTRSVTN